MLYFFLTVLALSATATVNNIKIRYDAKTPQFAILGHASYVCSTVYQVTHCIGFLLCLPTSVAPSASPCAPADDPGGGCDRVQYLQTNDPTGHIALQTK